MLPSRSSRLSGLALAFALSISPALAAATAAQWPQWGGPQRDFHAPAAKLVAWPEEGPRELWSRELGDGDSAIAMQDATLYTMYRRGDQEVVIAVDAASGKTRWEHAYDAPLWDGFRANFGPGPHATPLIDGDRLFTVGIATRLVSLDKTTGKKVWERDLWKEFGAKPSDRGYASSPIVHEGMLILPAGGKDGHAVMAFRSADGEVVWASQDFRNGFSSPIVIEVDGNRQLVVFMADRVAGLDPHSGALLWQQSHETKYGVNASTPLWSPEHDVLFISSAYDMGSRGLRLTYDDGAAGMEELWYSRKLKVHHGAAVRLGGVVYASSGDFGPAFLVAVNIESGDELFRQRGFAKANLVAAGQDLVILDEDGFLALAARGDGELLIKAKTKIFDTRSWTVPTLVGTTLYARDRQKMVALDLGG